MEPNEKTAAQVEILVVDDNYLNLNLLVAFMEDGGFQARSASSGEKALEEIAEKPPFLVLLDIRLTGMDGFEVCRRLKSDEKTSKIPVILISGLEDIASKTLGFAAGAVDFITKPFSKEEVLARIQTHVELRQMHLELEKQNAMLTKEVQERRKAEEHLHHALEHLKFHVENTPLAVVEFNHEYQVTMWSENAARMFGWDAHEVLGKKISEIPWVYNEDIEKVEKNTLELGSGLTTGNLHVNRNYRKDGTVITCEWYNSALYDTNDKVITVYSLVHDITDRIRAFEAIQQSNDLLNTALDIGSLAWWEMDVKTGATQFHERKAIMLGYPPEKFRFYTDFASILHPDDYNKAMEAMKEHLAGNREKYQVDYRIKTSKGDYRWFQDVGRITKWDEKGKPWKVMGMVRDITERKKAELEIRKLNEDLEQRVTERTAQLQAANKELEAFSYSVSHDLRAPLRAMDGFAKILIQDYATQLDEEGKRLLNLISGNAKKMGKLIDDLLAFSRLSRQEMQPGRINMEELVRLVCNELIPDRERNHLSLELKPLSEAYGDPSLLKQVWVNLIGNAIKFTGHKSSRIIEIGNDTGEGEEIVYYVRDNGAGFDMKYYNKLFGVFQRLHAAGEFEGTGVGLAIVQRIVHRMNGRVWAESKVEEGATFYFSLPSVKPVV